MFIKARIYRTGKGIVVAPEPDEKDEFNARSYLKEAWSPTPPEEALGYPILIFFHNTNARRKNETWGQEHLKASGTSVPILHILRGGDLSKLNEYSPLKCPRYARILDSSIWNYCFWRGSDGWSMVRLNRILEEMYHNWEQKLYQLGVSVEYADLNARLSENAYFEGGLHAEVISPFLFHSEYMTWTAMIRKLNQWPKTKGNAFCFGHKWRFLLLDDHAGTLLSECNTETPLVGGRNKLEIIVDRLQSLRGDGYPVKVAWRTPGASQWEGDKDDFDIAIDSVGTVPELVDRLFGTGRKRYDVILLDYLLLGKGTMDKEASYSYDFFYVLKSLRDIVEEKDLSDGSLRAIVENCEANEIAGVKGLEIKGDNLVIYGKASCPVSNKSVLRSWVLEGIGPMHRLYFMYISSFVHAIQERLEEQRISRAEKYWYIGRGACPVNTPEIFLFNLHIIMEKRYRKTVEKDEGGLFTGVPDFLNRIFDKDMSKDKDGVQRDCRRCFPELLRLKSVFEGLPRDLYPADPGKGIDATGSILLGSIFENWEYYTPDFWEHLQHLCYLISFGTVRQWPEWWEEYLFIRPVLEKTTDGKTVAGKIKEYIVSFAH